MEEKTTIAAALAWAVARLHESSPTARLDAELLLAYALGWTRAQVLAESRAGLTLAQARTFGVLVGRRADLEPVAYLTGHREFYGLDMLVDRRVLVPRPETELLVELAIEFMRRRMTSEPVPASPGSDRADTSDPSRFVIADIGTGSGCIAAALAAHLPDVRLIATDISAEALDVARANLELHGLRSRVELREGDLLDVLDEPVDLLVSNPPYTVLDQIDEGVRRHEPRLALDGGPDGLDLYRWLIARAPDLLRPGGALFLEIGAEQGMAVAKLARMVFHHAEITVHQDLAGRNRVVSVEIPARV
jgi:release factor glutamine methyltransferase